MQLSVSGLALPGGRALGVLAVLGYGWYTASAFRTQQFGFSILTLAVATIFILPVALLPFLGLRWRSLVFGTIATLLVALAAAEIVAMMEESRFYREHHTLPPDEPVVFQERQWPFAHHTMYHDPGSGRWGGCD